MLTTTNSRLTTLIPQLVIPAATEAGISSKEIPLLLAGFSTGSFTGISGLTPEILAGITDVYQTAFSKAVQTVYLISIVFGALAIGGALVSPDTSDRFTEDVARRMHGKENEMVNEKVQETV